MIDLGIDKMALIGVVALIVIGPEKLPRLARTVGTLLGKAQRYVSDVKAEVNRSIELDELKKMKETMEGAARDVESSVQSTANAFEKQVGQLSSDVYYNPEEPPPGSISIVETPVPEYRNPKKKWRTKQGAMPNWYKARTGVRTKALSGAARVARYRPAKPN